MDRAYSILEIRAAEERPDERIIEGIASTPSLDTYDTIIESKGARFSLPLPLLWQHKQDQPVGTVTFAKATEVGVTFRAVLPRIAEAGRLKDRVDEAWHSIKSGLVRGVSIGFRPVEAAIERLKDGGRRYKEWHWRELSLVTIPGNVEATILTIRQLDSELRAASGRAQADETPPAGATAIKSVSISARRGKTMNVQDQIRQFEATRSASSERMKALMSTAADAGRTLESSESEEYDTLEGEVRQVDEHLRRLRKLEEAVAPQAKPVAGNGTEQAMTVRSGAVISAGRSTVPKGTAFTRYCAALAFAKLHDVDPRNVARRWKDSTPEVLRALEIRADVGTTTDADWAAPLAYPANLASEFLELLTPMTILGRLNLNRVPFNVRIPVQTGAPLVTWVGEGLVKPVGQSAFTYLELGINKVAGIVVITEELARLSSPSAEASLGDQLRKSIAQYLDEQLLDPAVSANAGINPASLTNTAVAIPASGTDAASLVCDLGSLSAAFTNANVSTSGVALVMSEVMATRIGMLRTALGQTEFPGVSSSGGNLYGFRIVPSQNVPTDSSGTSIIVAIKESDVFLADEGGVQIDASREATLSLTGGNTADHNLWQRNEIAIRAERWITWKKGRDSAVQYISGAAYGACST